MIPKNFNPLAKRKTMRITRIVRIKDKIKTIKICCNKGTRNLRDLVKVIKKRKIKKTERFNLINNISIE